MSPFEYVMVLLSIVLGLGITHLLVGIGGLVYRVSGQGAPVRLYWGHLLWVAFVFTYLIGFWWWEFSWAGTETWGLLLYVFLVLYATSLFLLCVVLFPRRADDVTDFGSYFLAVRKWFYGLLLLVTGIDVAEAFLKGPEYLERLGTICIGASPSRFSSLQSSVSPDLADAFMAAWLPWPWSLSWFSSLQPIRCSASCHVAAAQPDRRMLPQACLGPGSIHGRGSSVLPDGTRLSFIDTSPGARR